jgi:hypothetical protein
MSFCSPAPDNTTSVCSSGPTKNFSGATSGTYNEAGIEPGDLFSVSIKAPVTMPVVRFGPGAGVTCLQRVSGPEVGSSSGITLTLTGLDWTGAGLPYYNFWFTRCSLDPGVTHAEFYAEFLAPT